jgi:hypothetical protein
MAKSTSFKVAPPPSSTSSSSSIQRPSSTSSSSYVPSFFGNMMDGFSFGTGASLARNMVDSVFRPTQPLSHSTSLSSSSCDTLHKTFMECMNKNNNDHYACSQAFEEYQTCTKK